MEYAQPEPFRPGDESGPVAARAALAAPRDGPDELPGDAGEDMESGPADDAGDDVDDELAAVAVDDDELQLAMTQMPLVSGDQRKLDVAAFIAGQTQRERPGSRGSASQSRWPAARDTGLQSRGEPHQLSYYGLNDAVCQARAGACRGRARLLHCQWMTKMTHFCQFALFWPGVCGEGHDAAVRLADGGAGAAGRARGRQPGVQRAHQRGQVPRGRRAAASLAAALAPPRRAGGAALQRAVRRKSSQPGAAGAAAGRASAPTLQRPQRPAAHRRAWHHRVHLRKSQRHRGAPHRCRPPLRRRMRGGRRAAHAFGCVPLRHVAA